ncbi:MAG TPA: carbamate kinase, partial [Candidatus Lachnoclostridium stercoravium]|nr:carbamate kinase [Candidatus Lachnoclostridium stercoravium]
MEKTVVVAIGGNAITQNNQKGTVEEQFANVAKVCDSIINLLEAGYRVVLTHGNGPQVGNLLIKNEAGKLIVPEHTLDVCGAETSGSIGYIIEQSLQNRLVERHIDKKVATVITETVVDKNDKAFLNPTKPIGPFFTEEESRQLE